MGEPGPSDWEEIPLGDVFAQVPLFREIQRVLLASTGPVNWELARQVGVALASYRHDEPAPSDEDRRMFEETVRVAELHVADATGLAPPPDVARVEVFRRPQWVEANIRSLRELVEPAAEKVGQAFARSQLGAVPEEPGVMAAQVGEALGKVTSLLLGMQVGTVLGYLAQRVMAQYDVAVPPPSPGSLYFVASNIASFERDWSLPPVELRAWVALHEVTHRFEFARPWAREHLVSLVRDFMSTLELDLQSLMGQIEHLDLSRPEALEELFQKGQGLFEGTLDPEQRLKLDRIQAFMAAAEGYSEHVMRVVGRRMMRSYAQIDEAVRRHREEVEPGRDPVFERLLGIELKREQYRVGLAFCDRVVELTDEATLARMWESAEALPSMPELSEPRLWLARMA